MPMGQCAPEIKQYFLRDTDTRHERRQRREMSTFLSLPDAVRALIHDGDSVAMEGFTHLIPFAAGHELIRQQIRHLSLIRMTPDIIYDQLIGMGAADHLTFSWVAIRASARCIACVTRSRMGGRIRSGSMSIHTRRWRALMTPVRPTCRSRRSAATRDGSSEGQSQHPLDHLPVHGRSAGRSASDPSGRLGDPRATRRSGG